MNKRYNLVLIFIILINSICIYNLNSDSEKEKTNIDQLLRDLFNKEDNIRYRAIEKLGELKSKEAVKPLINILLGKYYCRWNQLCGA